MAKHKKVGSDNYVAKQAAKNQTKKVKAQIADKKAARKNEQRQIKSKERISTKRDRTIRRLGLQGTSAAAAMSAEREKTKRQLSSDNARIQTSLAQWQSLYNSNPQPSTGSDGETQQGSTTELNPRG